jgi:hypothetical protein
MVCFFNIPSKVNKKSNNFQPFWEHLTYMENWKSVYDNPKIIPTQIEGILILNGFDILNKCTLY